MGVPLEPMSSSQHGKKRRKETSLGSWFWRRQSSVTRFQRRTTFLTVGAKCPSKKQVKGGGAYFGAQFEGSVQFSRKLWLQESEAACSHLSRSGARERTLVPSLLSPFCAFNSLGSAHRQGRSSPLSSSLGGTLEDML